jgi:TetR/AcrR family transcriptional regulator, regulator of cefoperazone and chloramphenicol sensitivity
VSRAGRDAGPGWIAQEDLTAKARIRNAAMELHAEKGAANTTLREVARAAGVTPGLVVHHFGSKEALRRAVQQHMIDLLNDALGAVPSEGTPEEIGRARDASVRRLALEHPAFTRYVRRAMFDPVEGESELFDVAADFTLAQVRELRAAGLTRTTEPAEVQALSIMLREAVPSALEPLIERLWARLTHGDPSFGPPPELRVRAVSRPGD